MQEVISTAESLLNLIKRIGPVLVIVLILIFFACLSIIQTNLECATDNSAETIKENEQWLDNIKAETKRMAKLVNDLLTLSRSDGSEQAVYKAEFSLDELLQKTVSAMQPYAKKDKAVNLQ